MRCRSEAGRQAQALMEKEEPEEAPMEKEESEEAPMIVELLGGKST